jgi:serine/threonine protein kinase
MGPHTSNAVDLTGRLLGERYLVERRIGEGGEGKVFLALDQELKRRVVVKTPLAGLAVSDQGRRRFEAEIEFLTNLVNPHIVTVHGRGLIDGLDYVVLQYLEGGSLQDRLGSGRSMSRGDVLAWLEPVAKALDSTHRRNRLHRDVKPANILFDLDGNAYLADFGIAKALDAEGPTRPGTLPGTPVYMGPEAFGGNLTFRYDQYALAVVVYQCFAGKLPFPLEDPWHAEELYRHFDSKAKTEPERIDALGDGGWSCLRRALDPDPQKRFGTCVEFFKAFKAALEPGGTEVIPDPRPAGRRRAVRLAFAATALLSVAILVWSWLQRVDVKIRSDPSGASLSYDGVQHTTPAELKDLRRGRVYRLTLSKPGYESRELALDPSSAAGSSPIALLPSCSGSPPSTSPYPVRVFLEGVEPEQETRIADRFLSIATIVGAGCDSDARIAAGSDLSMVDSQGRLLARAPATPTEADMDVLSQQLERLHLVRLLLAPPQRSEATLGVAVSTRCTPPAELAPAVSSRFDVGESACFFARSGTMDHALALALYSNGRVGIVHPEDLDAFEDRIPESRWHTLTSGIFSEPAGVETLIVLARGRSWSSTFENIAASPARQGMALPEFGPESDPSAAVFVSLLSTYLTASDDWARASTSYSLVPSGTSE